MPRGICADFPRSTAHTRKDAPLRERRSDREAPSSTLPGLTNISAISKRLRVKLSHLTADGNFNMSYIALAVSLSGLMTIESSSCFFIKSRSLLVYSPERMRATVCFAPMRFARKQLSIFISSESAAAINSSALPTFASVSALQLVA